MTHPLEGIIKLYSEPGFFTEHGFVIHPLSDPTDRSKSAGKKPLLSGWQNLLVTPDIEKFPQNCNIGIVCGNASGVIVIDYDDDLIMNSVLKGLCFETLRSNRITGRGHIYFKYTDSLPPSKHQLLNIEVLSDGSNAVIPPSVHATGMPYKWNDDSLKPIEIPKELISRLFRVFEIESNLKSAFSGCRPCFQNVLKNPDTLNYHGTEGRQWMVALVTELKTCGANLGEINLLSKLIYKKEYNPQITKTEFNNISSGKNWKCETLRHKLPTYIDCINCKSNKKPSDQESLTITVPTGVKKIVLNIE